MMKAKRLAGMKTGRDLMEKFMSRIFIYYILLVYKTSRVSIEDDLGLLGSGENFVIGFWHGESYCLYPAFRGRRLYVVTTRDLRGDYISLICRFFGYTPIRVPDESAGGNFLFEIRKMINGEGAASLAVALDGPLGPYHEPKAFAFAAARLSRRRVLPVTVECSLKLASRHRWDRYIVPLPFGEIRLKVHMPFEVGKDDMKEDFEALRETVKKSMEMGEEHEN